MKIIRLDATPIIAIISNIAKSMNPISYVIEGDKLGSFRSGLAKKVKQSKIPFILGLWRKEGVN